MEIKDARMEERVAEIEASWRKREESWERERAEWNKERRQHLDEARSLRHELSEMRRELVSALRLTQSKLVAMPEPRQGPPPQIEPPAVDVSAYDSDGEDKQVKASFQPQAADTVEEEQEKAEQKERKDEEEVPYDPLFDEAPAGEPATPAKAAAKDPLGALAGAGEAPASAPKSDLPVEFNPVGDIPPGERPVLCMGADDIKWMATLHKALDDAGFHPGDEDMEEWLFQGGTQEALFFYQACNGLEETGIADAPTWEALLGPVEAAKGEADKPKDADGASKRDDDKASEKDSTTPVTPPRPVASASVTTTTTATTKEETATVSTKESKDDASASESTSTTSASETVKRQMLMYGDGGVSVRYLQLVLAREGFFCGDEDTEWWQFGDSTENALKTFQESNKLTVTGTALPEVWDMMLEKHDPEEVLNECNDEYCDDVIALQQAGAVFLLGEGRWEIPKYVQEKRDAEDAAKAEASTTKQPLKNGTPAVGEGSASKPAEESSK